MKFLKNKIINNYLILTFQLNKINYKTFKILNKNIKNQKFSNLNLNIFIYINNILKHYNKKYFKQLTKLKLYTI